MSFRSLRSMRFESLEPRTMLAITAVGGELRLNEPVHGLQYAPADAAAIATLPDGGYVATYAGRSALDRSGVSVRRFDADDSQVGATQLVNTTIQGGQIDPSLAVLADGSFVVAWAGRGQGDKQGIFAQWFDNNGDKVGGEVLVNETTGGRQSTPQVVVVGNGIAIAWQGVGEGDFDGIYVRTFAADGTPTSDELLVNTTTTNEQADAAIAGNDDGSFVVAWSSRHQDGADWGVFAQRFAVDGTPTGDEFAVNTSTDGSQQRPAVAMLPSGDFEIAFQNRVAGDMNESILAQRFTSAGVAAGDEVQLDDGAAALRRDVALAAIPAGGFVASWASGVEDGSGWEVKVRDFDATGTALADEVFANLSSMGANSGHQQASSLAVADNNQLLVAWNGSGETDRRGVFAQRIMTDGEIDNGVQQAPTLAFIPDQQIANGESLMLTITASDPNPLDLLTLQLDPSNSPAGATLLQSDFTAGGSTAVISWTPSSAEDNSTVTFTVLVTDNGDPTLADSQEFQVTVGTIGG